MPLQVSLVFALALPIAPLARLTSGITLAVFALANFSLLRIQMRDPAPEGIIQVPRWVPAVGAVTSAGFLVLEIARLSLG